MRYALSTNVSHGTPLLRARDLGNGSIGLRWVFGSRQENLKGALNIKCCPQGMCVPEQQTVRNCEQTTCNQHGLPGNISKAFGANMNDFTICYGKGFVSGKMTNSLLSLGSPRLG